MPERKIDPLYNMRRTNLVFMASSVVLAVVSVGIVAQDFIRPWKDYQRRFRQEELKKTKRDLAATQEKLQKEHGEELTKLKADAAAATAQVEAKQSEIAAAEKEFLRKEADWYPADQAYRFKKSELDTIKYDAEYAEENKLAGADAKRKQATDADNEWHELGKKEEQARKLRDEAKAKVDALVAEKTKLEAQLTALTRDQTRLETKITRLEPNFQEDYFRNLPVIDFVSPSIKVQQIVVPTLYDDIGFETRVPKVERCITCHLAIDKTGWDDPSLPKEFRSHPRISVPPGAPEGTRPDFLTATSPHPMETFACTVCHGGMPQAVDFQRANHAPPNKAVQAVWEKEHGWHLDHYWDFPMKPMPYVEAGCVKCHSSEVDVPGARRVALGKHLFQKNGCFGCHNVVGQGFEKLRKVGPDLRRVKAKVEPDWAYRWIRHPKAFRPTTRMPKIFDLSNTSDEIDQRRASVSIDGIVTYLMEKSEDFPLPASIPTGDAAKGNELFNQVGCKGCHVIGTERNGASAGFEDFGPNLAGIGSKLKPEWIYAWVKDPKAYFPDTRMPDLRLTDEEAADIAAYLTSLKLEDTPSQEPGKTQAELFASVRKDEADDKLLDEMTVEQLRKSMRLDEAEAKLGGMQRQEKLLLVGERFIARQGCAGCHMIPGFEQAQPIGTDLTDQGRKLVLRLDYGFEAAHGDGGGEHHAAGAEGGHAAPEPAPGHDAAGHEPAAGHDAAGHGSAPDDSHQAPVHVAAKGEAVVDHTLDAFIYNKLLEPRRYDRGKIKSFEEKLKMPYFAFSEEEARAITTFVLGLTKEYILPSRKKILNPREADIEAGRRLIRERNCMGCHVIEGVGGDVRAFYSKEELGNAPPMLYRQGAKVQSDWLFSFLKEVKPIRPWLKIRMPTFHFTDEEATIVSRYFAAFDNEPYPFATVDMPTPPDDKREAAAKLFAQCMQCHVAGDVIPPGKTSDQLAPDLLQARDRLRGKWIADWLKDPQKLLPGTKMPNFFYDEGNPLYPDADEQILALRHHIFNVDAATVVAQAKAAAEAAAAAPAAEGGESYE